MKVQCLQENLTKGLSIVGRAVATRTTLPVTQNILIETEQAGLKLSATNLEMAITTWVGGVVEEPGEMTVPARLLSEFVGSLTTEQINLESNEENTSLIVIGGKFKGTIHGTSSDEFPPVPKIDDGVEINIDISEFRQAVSRVAFSVATEESRPVLTGVKFELHNAEYVLAGADGFRLAVHEGKLTTPVSEDIEGIIPGKSLQELNRLLGETDESLYIRMSPEKGQIFFKVGDVELVSQLLAGTFPNYKPLIPTEHKTKVRAPLSEWTRIIKSASIFARDGSGIVKLEIVPGSEEVSGKVVVEARAEDIGTHSGEIDVEVEGEASKIAFNSRYLIDVLQNMDTGNITLEVLTPSSPGVFRMENVDNYLHVVMPMFVQW